MSYGGILNLPEPTPIQYDIAEYLQSDTKRSVIEAFRGVGKSYITSAYCCHTLLLDPQKKILVVSASKIRADDFSTFTQRLINRNAPSCPSPSTGGSTYVKDFF